MKFKCLLCGNVQNLWYKDLYDDRHGYKGLFSVYRCPDCGFCKTFPSLKDNDLTDLYSNYYPRKNLNVKDINIKDHKPQSEEVLYRKGLKTNTHLFAKKGSDVLDVGSGIGYSLLELKNMGCYPYGLDPDTNAQKLAKKFKIPFHFGLINDNPYPGKKFDYICASQVLEHTTDPLEFVRMCSKKLKPGGELILSFPNPDSFTRRLLGRKWLHWHIPFHQNFMSRKAILLLVKKTGLKLLDIKTVTPNLWTNLQIRRLIISPHQGVRDTFWDGRKSMGKSDSGPKILERILMTIFSILENSNPLNRLLDDLNLGESYVIRLSLPKVSKQVIKD